MQSIVSLALLTEDRFRWAACQLDVLEKCLHYPQLKKALASLPITLDGTYSRILDAIPADYKADAVRILQFLTFSKRPLSIEEAVDAIAVDAEAEPYFDTSNRMPDPREISRICSSLVIVVSTKSQKLLQLAHFSVKEYLTSDRLQGEIAQSFKQITASATIAGVCLAFLLHFKDEQTVEEVETRFPLAQYTSEFWMSFAAVAEREDERLLSLIGQFLFSQGAPYRVCYSLHCPDRPYKGYKDNKASSIPSPPLYYAALGGLQNSVQLLLDKNADVNAQGGVYGNALHAASVEGHEAVVKLLLDKNADVNAQGGEYGNALHAASVEGHEAVVKLLLDKNADVNAQGGKYGNALQAASARGHEAIVKLLLDKNADVNAQGGEYGNALQAASAKGHEAIVKLLLDKNADVIALGLYYGKTPNRSYGKMQDRYCSNALYAASARGHKAVVKLLLDKNADVNAEDGRHGNALHAASAEGHEAVVKLLLDKNADVNAQGGKYGNALQAASAGGHEAVVKLLLEQNASINADDPYYSSLLQSASAKGDEAVVRSLLEMGVNVNAQSRPYGNALYAAIARGHKEIVRLLRENGAQPFQIPQQGM
jgi:ankyrin repeat protein